MWLRARMLDADAPQNCQSWEGKDKQIPGPHRPNSQACLVKFQAIETLSQMKLLFPPPALVSCPVLLLYGWHSQESLSSLGSSSLPVPADLCKLLHAPPTPYLCSRFPHYLPVSGGFLFFLFRISDNSFIFGFLPCIIPDLYTEPGKKGFRFPSISYCSLSCHSAVKLVLLPSRHHWKHTTLPGTLGQHCRGCGAPSVLTTLFLL